MQNYKKSPTFKRKCILFHLILYIKSDFVSHFLPFITYYLLFCIVFLGRGVYSITYYVRLQMLHSPELVEKDKNGSNKFYC